MITALAKIIDNTIVDKIIGDHADFPDYVPLDIESPFSIGDFYINGVFSKKPVQNIPQEENFPRLISIGAFKDRLGVNALAISVSTNPICVALRELLYDRQYIDLDREDFRNYMMMLVSNNLPESRIEFPGSGPLTEEIVNAIINNKVREHEKP